MADRFDLLYRVRPASPQAHLFAVELEIPRPPAGELTLSMPAWIPGSYMIRDFARNVVSIQAQDQTGVLHLVKEDKQTWRLPHRGGAVVLRWQVYAWELTVRAAHLDTTHGYFNGPCLFLRVAGLDRVPCRVEIEPPAGAGYESWRAITSLQALETGGNGFGAYRADDYDDLIDHPVEMGTFTLIPFEVGGVPHRMAISGRHRADEQRLQRDVSRICETHAALFGELPVDRYVFLTTATGDGYGGLEHRFSSSLLCSRNELPGAGMDEPDEGYRRFLGLCSHEYFHLWHVKRIRPKVFLDQGLEREVHTRLLWAFEGITSYYDELALVRSGCIGEKAYLTLLAETISRVLRNPGRLLQTVAESSFDAWTRFYKQDENAPNAIVSYYAKGALVALALDLAVRRETAGAKSLDDLMRALWQRHGRSGIGVEERGIESLAEEVTGLDLGGFFAAALDSTEDLDLPGLLADVGVGLRMRPAKGPKDLGGVGEEAADEEPAPLTLGLRLSPTAAEPVIGVVLTDGPAMEAGLAAGDTLVALDGVRVSRDNLDQLVAAAGDGARVRLHAFRRDELMEFRVRPRPAPADTCELYLPADAPDEARRRRAAWLGTET
jgi:predicted metalloprotease with PDZ domain